ncbi:hypothetical protein C4552_03580 [Candidatus Parcubacteria bacterium]|nr:MAG: hypothetical protein C4552_03580 [Candidatus Parcubacteria bacterium]
MRNTRPVRYNMQVIRRPISEGYVSRKNVKRALAVILAAGIVGFFVYESRFLTAPDLTLIAPERDIAIAETVYDVRGRTDPDADVSINGRPLYIAPTGEFSERLQLFNGVNRLDFVAKNRYGKQTIETRYIIVKNSEARIQN